ncbi:hypothetical protein, partial [Plasmodium yoelii yoelii]
MKNTVLRIKAELENVKRIYCDDDFLWAFNIRDSVSTLTRENITFSKTDQLAIPNKYPKYSTINFVNTKKSCSYDSTSNEWQDFATFECRG